MPTPSFGPRVTAIVAWALAAGCQPLGSAAPDPDVPAARSTADQLAQTLAHALRLSVPWTGHDGWHVERGVDGSFASYASASARHADGTWLTITAFDLEGAAEMTAAGDLTPTRPWHDARGFHERTSATGMRVHYRLNPPGGYFGGEMRIFVGDRYVVRAQGSRLTMESIGDHAHRVARALAAHQ
jgi:hypothetical protein